MADTTIQSSGVSLGAAPSMTIMDENIGPYVHPYSFKLGKDYKTQEEYMRAMYSANGLTPHGYNAQLSTQYTELINGTTQDNNVFTMTSRYNTVVGGMNSLNFRWAFNRDDDIVHPTLALGGDPANGGLGRVYAENYWNNEQLVYITVGVPEFNSLVSFYSNCIDKDRADDVNSGDGFHLARFIGKAVAGVVKLAFYIPTIPFRFIRYIADALDPDARITKYYDIRPSMPLYYRYVNSIFVTLATNMGFTPGFLGFDSEGKAGSGGKSMSYSNETVTNLIKGSFKDSPTEPDKTKLPYLLQDGPDVFTILNRRNKETALGKLFESKTIDDFIKASEKINTDYDYDSEGWFSAFFGARDAVAYGATKYISFRVNKSTDSTESLSNSTGQSSVQQFLNSQVSSAKDATFNLFNGKIADVPILGKVLSGVKSFAEGVVNIVGVGNLATSIMTGAGFIDIPEVWMSSSFTKSYSFSMEFRPGAGDNLSVLQTLYFPLCFLLPLACPRTVGDNSYTSPFLVRAYCKGMFAIPLGILDSMTISRGAPEFGWNHARLPTVIKVSFTIKDLSPIMHLAIVDEKNLATFAQNSNFQEYMMTLSGLGYQERLDMSYQFSRRIQKVANSVRYTLGDTASYLGTLAGGTALGRMSSLVYSSSAVRD